MTPGPDNLRRIQLLSSRFHELQGLRVALAGACITFVVGAYFLVWPDPTNDGTIFAVGVSFLPAVTAMPWVSRYYATHFGRKVIAKLEISKWWIVAFVAFNAVGFWLNATYPQIPAGAPTLWTVGLLSIFVVIRDWPWRIYYLLAPAAVAAGFAFAPGVSAAATLAPGLTLPLIFMALGASMVVIGILDHLTLVRLVKDARAASLSALKSP